VLEKRQDLYKSVGSSKTVSPTCWKVTFQHVGETFFEERKKNTRKEKKPFWDIKLNQ
jgi:hypothetical protein